MSDSAVAHDLRCLLDSSGTMPAILNASHNGIVIIDRHGTVVFYNSSASRIFNDSPERNIGRHFSAIRPEAWPDLKHVLETGQAQIGQKITLPQATIIVNRSPIIIDGRIVGAISVFQETSEYEAIISKLECYQTLNRELEAIFESSEDGLYITDNSATTIRINSAYERITGLSRENLLGKTMQTLVSEGVFDCSVTLEVLEKRCRVNLLQNIRGGKQVIVTGTPTFNDNGDIVCIVTNVRDITELNQLRSDLENSRMLNSRYCRSLLEQEGLEQMLSDMQANSSSMLQVVQRAVKVSGLDVSVLISGKSGTGKSMLARAIHQMSGRRDRPFVKINCGSIPESLIESELFGYVKGAFTGALHEGKAGLIEAAHGGTLFLDEIGELKLDLQVKLLEVIEEKTITRVGSARKETVDIRVIAATHRDLPEMIRNSQFREDLFYRLNVVLIEMPPLSSRREDIPALARKFLAEFNQKNHAVKRMAPAVLRCIQEFSYPGNVRQLRNIVEQMAAMSENETITLDDVPLELVNSPLTAHGASRLSLGMKEALEVMEKQMVRAALERHPTEMSAARSLGIHVTTLWRKARRYGLK